MRREIQMITAAQFEMSVRESVTRCHVNAIAYRHSAERTQKSVFLGHFAFKDRRIKFVMVTDLIISP